MKSRCDRVNAELDAESAQEREAKITENDNKMSADELRVTFSHYSFFFLVVFFFLSACPTTNNQNKDKYPHFITKTHDEYNVPTGKSKTFSTTSTW